MVFHDPTRSTPGYSGTNRYDRLDVFKYTLASYACIDRITDVIIYCELGEGYKPREEELKNYINSIFNGRNINFYNYSLTHQSHWQKALLNSPVLTTDKPILFSCNDDHVFIDYDLDVLYEGADLIEKENKEYPEQINTIFYTHWPEVISITWELNTAEQVGRYFKQNALSSLPAQMVNNKFFEHAFFDLDWGDTFCRRTDAFLTNWYPELGLYAFNSKKEHPPVKMFVPLRELVRHFDGYIHVGCKIDNCPRLEIPPGFFENNIKINYCGERKEGYYNINPFSAYYWREGISCGADDKRMIEDLPYFWKNKISLIEDNSKNYKKEDIVNARNLIHKKLITCPHNRGVEYREWKHGYRYNPYAMHRAGHDSILPLDEKYVKIGYRQV